MFSLWQSCAEDRTHPIDLVAKANKKARKQTDSITLLSTVVCWVKNGEDFFFFFFLFLFLFLFLFSFLFRDKAK